MMLLFPIKKIRKHFKVLVFVVILGLGVWAAYLEFVASSEWRRSGAFKPHREFRNWKKQSHVQRNKVLGVDRDLEYYNQRKEEAMNEDPESNHLQLNDKLSFAEVWKPEGFGKWGYFFLQPKSSYILLTFSRHFSPVPHHSLK